MKTMRLSRFSSCLPVALVVALDDHVHALDHIALIVVRKRDDPLEPQDVRPVELGDLLDPGKELLRIDGPARSEID
jgi:hypothetical protein